MDNDKRQIPNAKSQTDFNDPNPKFLTELFQSLDIEIWNLFGDWSLGFVILVRGFLGFQFLSLRRF
jgi:hypothetical protein